MNIHNLLSLVGDVYQTEDLCVAGGYVRDTGFNLEPKDVDLFINIDTELNLECCTEMLDKAFGKDLQKPFVLKDFDKDDAYEEPVNDNIPSPVRGILEGQVAGLPPIQLIAHSYPNRPKTLTWGEMVLTSFDYHLCMGFTDLEGTRRFYPSTTMEPAHCLPPDASIMRIHKTLYRMAKWRVKAGLAKEYPDLATFQIFEDFLRLLADPAFTKEIKKRFNQNMLDLYDNYCQPQKAVFDSF